MQTIKSLLKQKGATLAYTTETPNKGSLAKCNYILTYKGKQYWTEKKINDIRQLLKGE